MPKLALLQETRRASEEAPAVQPVSELHGSDPSRIQGSPLVRRTHDRPGVVVLYFQGVLFFLFFLCSAACKCFVLKHKRSDL